MTTKIKAIIAGLLCTSTLFFCACTASQEKEGENTPKIPDETITESEDENKNDDAEKSETNSDDEVIENVGTQPVEVENKEVYDYADITRKIIPTDKEMASWGDEFTMSFRVPAINLESDNARTFNEKIFAHYPQYAFETDFDETPIAVDRIYRYDYICDVTDKAIAAIIIKKQVGYYYSEYGTDYVAFYYDLKGDCEVSSAEYLDSLDIDSDEFFDNVQKNIYIKAAHGEIFSTYDFYFVDEHISVGECVIASENDGFLMVEISGEYGYYLEDFPISSEDFLVVPCTNNAHIYKTPSIEAEVIGVLDGGTQVYVVTKAELAEGLQTIEFDSQFSWCAVDYQGIYGYMLAHELEF